MVSLKTDVEIQLITYINSKPHGVVICIDGSVTGDLSGWESSKAKEQGTKAIISAKSSRPILSWTYWTLRVTTQTSAAKTTVIYCPGCVKIRQNEQADRLASTNHFTTGLHLSRAEVPRGLGNLRNISNLGLLVLFT